MGSSGRARRTTGHAAAQAGGVCAGRVGLPECAADPGGRELRGRTAPLQQAPRRRPLPRQEGRGAGLQQLGPRHLRRPVGTRCRRHHGAAQLDPHRPLGIADGTGLGRPVLRAGGEERHRPPHRRPGVRLGALQDHAHLPHPGVRRDEEARCRSLFTPGEGRLQARLR